MTEKLDAWYAGKTKNPSDPTITKGMPDRNVIEEDTNELVKEHLGVKVCHPFLYTEKDWIISQYIKHDILDLLNITRSCEGDFKDLDYTNYIPGQEVPECGECFWCQERKWAMDKNNV
jgi:hypothetical protein